MAILTLTIASGISNRIWSIPKYIFIPALDPTEKFLFVQNVHNFDIFSLYILDHDV